MRSSGARITKTKFLLESGTCDVTTNTSIYDPLCEFKQTNPSEVYEIITANQGVTIQRDVTKKSWGIGLTPIADICGSYSSPTNIKVNTFGQVTQITAGSTSSAIFSAVSGFDNVVFPSPTSVTSKATTDCGWTGRWYMNSIFIHPFRMAFDITSSVSIVGIAKTNNINAPTVENLLTMFYAAFYFDSPTTVSVINNTSRDQSAGVIDIHKIGNRIPTDRFSILFNGHQFVYYKNGGKVYTHTIAHSSTTRKLYVAGGFLIKRSEIQKLTNLTIQDVYETAEVNMGTQPIMRCVNGIPLMLRQKTITLVHTSINTTVDGTIAAWATVTSSDPIILKLIIRGQNMENSVDLESNGSQTIFYGTEEFFPPGYYTIVLCAKASDCESGSDSSDSSDSSCSSRSSRSSRKKISIDTSRLMVMGQLL